MGDVARLREKNVANMADKKKRLEITRLFCRVLVRQLADKDPRLEIGSRASAKIGGGLGKCGGLARILGEFACFQDRHKAARWRSCSGQESVNMHIDASEQLAPNRGGWLTIEK
jgi:hypothetical protein